MITRQEKDNSSENASRKAEISEFEKTEMKKALDEIVDGTMKEKKTKVESKVVKKSAVMKSASGGKRIDFVKKSPTKKKVATKETAESIAKKDVERPVAKKAVKKAVARGTAKTPRASKPSRPPKVPGHKLVEKKKLERSPLVSVILPVHNGARYIDSAIHSVLGQTFSDFELIIVDDCSEDGTVRVVREFASDKISIITLTQKSGMAEARNRGVEAARGRYIAFLNARDMWQPDKLEMQLAFMDENKAAFSYTGYVFSDENGIPSGKAVKVPPVITSQQILKTSGIWVSTVMFDLNILSEEDIKMPTTQNSKNATWQKVVKKVKRAYGLNEVMVIRGYDFKAPFWKKAWRRV